MSLVGIVIPIALAAEAFKSFLDNAKPTRYPTNQPTNSPSKTPQARTHTYDINPLAGVSVVYRPTLEFFYLGNDAPILNTHDPEVWRQMGWSGKGMNKWGSTNRLGAIPVKVQYWPSPKKEHLLLKCGDVERVNGKEVSKEAVDQWGRPTQPAQPRTTRTTSMWEKKHTQYIYLYGSARYLGLPNDPHMLYDTYRVMKDGHEAIRIEVEGKGTNMHKLGTLNLRIQEQRMNPDGYYQMVWMDGSPIVWQNELLKTQTIQVQYGFTVFRFKSGVHERRIKVPDQPDIVIPYTALDVTMDQPDGAADYCKEGIIAELWGAAPLTEETQKMLRPPEKVPGTNDLMVMQEPHLPTPGMWETIKTRDWKAEALAAEKVRIETAVARRKEDERLAKILIANQQKVADAMLRGLSEEELALHKAHMAETERLRQMQTDEQNAKRPKELQNAHAAAQLHGSIQAALKDRTFNLWDKGHDGTGTRKNDGTSQN